MSLNGTDAYDGRDDLPPLVASAVAAARSAGFTKSCTPAQGRLLQLLAAGVGQGVIGETGTGCGVGLAWLASGAEPSTRLVSIELDPDRAAAAAAVFAHHPAVRVRPGDWRELAADGPFDLLVLDGGGQGKSGGPPIDPAEWLKVGGTLVMDDFTPFTAWPPMYLGEVDTARLHWLQHPLLLTTEIRIAPDAASLVGVRCR
jgi:predicted O-methyltransferase YrrM